MEFKHKDLLDEFNRQVQSGEYEKGWWKWEHCCNGQWYEPIYSPTWIPNVEYRYSKTEKHPDNNLLDVGDIVKSWYFTAVIAKIDYESSGSEKYFAVITANEGTQGRACGNESGKLLDGAIGTREYITKYFDGYKVIKKNGK